MIDLGEYLLDADDRCVTLHRKTIRTNRKTGVESPHVEVVGHYATFAQAATRLAHIVAADAVRARRDVDQIRIAVHNAATRLENAIHNVNSLAVTP